MLLRKRLMQALENGDIGHSTPLGIEFSSAEYILFFDDLNPLYRRAFLPASTIESGRTQATNVKFLYRIRRGHYRLHHDAINIFKNEAINHEQNQS